MEWLLIISLAAGVDDTRRSVSTEMKYPTYELCRQAGELVLHHPVGKDEANVVSYNCIPLLPRNGM